MGDESLAFEDGRLTKSSFSDYLLIDICCSCFAFLGIMLSILAFELEFEERNPEINTVICYFLMISSIISAIISIPKYLSYIDWKIARNEFAQNETLFSSGLWFSLIIEMLFNLVHPTPFTIGIRVDITADREYLGEEELYYHVNEILIFILMLRVYFVIRTLLMQTSYFSNRS